MSSEGLNVIALISGGKDSFFSILHCLANGHRIVALANLHPPLQGNDTTEHSNVYDEGEDLNSFMYQTVGHSITPLYEEALGIPLYRQAIQGSAINTHRDYTPGTGPTAASHPSATVASSSSTIEASSDDADETESLVPLLRRVLRHHPEANAISTGAILSTYQRTRVESVALRLDLVPLSYLWQYPYLPPYEPSSLLCDLARVGQDARIIKVASGGLDDSFLWLNVGDPRTVSRLERATNRFGGEGAVLGEGGEFETLVLDGPVVLWKKRLSIETAGNVNEDGGNALVRFGSAKVVEKEASDAMQGLDELRIPPLLDDEFVKLSSSTQPADQPSTLWRLRHRKSTLVNSDEVRPETSLLEQASWCIRLAGNTFSITNMISTQSTGAIDEQLTFILTRLKHALHSLYLEASDIALTTILLRSMSSFASVNALYGSLFPQPLPPARVTIACGEAMPKDCDISISVQVNVPLGQFRQLHVNALQAAMLTISDLPDAEERLQDLFTHFADKFRLSPITRPRTTRKGLHVQSRSYWAPANIGPYSQAIATPLVPAKPVEHDHEDDEAEPAETASASSAELVNIAGQIPLIPASMALPTAADIPESVDGFTFQAQLSLQHLLRVGRATNVSNFIGAIAVLAECEEKEAERRASAAMRTGKAIHENAWHEQNGEDVDEDDPSFDIWHARHGQNSSVYGSNLGSTQKKDSRALLPDYSQLTAASSATTSEPTVPMPPVFAIMVSSLPREAPIEWISSGLSNTPVRIAEHSFHDGTDETIDGDSVIHIVKPTASSEAFVWAALREITADSLSRVGAEISAVVGSGGDGAIWTLYVASDPRLSCEDGCQPWVLQVGAAVVPCLKVWCEDGEVDAVLCARLGTTD